MSDNIQYLQKVPLFGELSRAQLEEINRIVLEREYKKGRIIFVEDEPGEAIYFLKKGLIKLSKQVEDGREHILHLVYPGDIFAEVVIFDSGNYPATAEVLEDANVGLIRNKDMDQVISKHPDTALAMLKIMSRRLREAQSKVMNLALNDTSRRLAVLLLGLAEERGIKKKDGSVIIPLQLTNQDLANLIGTSRETVNRTLNSFKRSGALTIDRQQIILYNRDKLKALL
ncbi:Crp/Fnr family transcriptional regulator [Desulfolucanica intricata]|uniref:Crp/Fnr family transcriptional regulator n=1 Tax=Desulfolucanica intricata TaxID=1285191 RepID=UPI0008345747|nr:Crp/Fnr family transcriptional regulator [Desulfolucanica intricata]